MTDDATSASRGHLILKSHAPLPRFTCAIPVPPPNSLIFQLRNTVVAILTGQVSATKHDRRSGASTAADSGLSYSEHLKQQTVHEWRLKSIVLELCQNALIAPETRSRMDNDNDDESGQREKGFLLLDEHECALLEHGDEVNIWLKEGQQADSLRLPKLPSRHAFGLPNQPSLTRTGTLLNPPPPYSTAPNDHFAFGAPSASLLEPAEPSSHSSSVSAHPDGQFETTMRHRSAPSGWHRVVVYNPQAAAGNGQNGVSAAVKHGKRAKPKRLMSDEGPNALVEQIAKPAAPVRHNSASSPLRSAVGMEKEAGGRSPPTSPPVSPPLSSNKEILRSQSSAGAAPSRAEKTEREKVRKAGQRSMPSQALIIGPGVQGKVGRVNSMESKNGASHESGVDAGNADYGNLDAFVSFTAASSEVHQIKQSGPAPRRMSNRSAMSDKMTGLTGDPNRPAEALNGSGGRASGSSTAAALAAAENSKREKSKPPVKRYVKLPDRVEIPPIRNLAPFDETQGIDETLLAMPMPTAIGTPGALPTLNSTQSQPEVEMAQDAALAYALSQSLSVSTPAESRPTAGGRKSSSSSAQDKRTISRRTTAEVSSPPSLSADTSSTPIVAISPRQSPSLTRKSSESPVQSRDESTTAPSKAERRFNDVKRALEAEKSRQAEQERLRRDKARKSDEEKVKTSQRMEQERRQREEKMRWQLWDEVRLRQTKKEQTR